MAEDCPVISDEDLRAALREIRTYVDVTEEDLRRIYTLALEHARQRLARRALVAEVMTTAAVAVTPEQDVHEAAHLLSEHRVSGLPVVDAEGRVIGLVSEADLLSAAGLRQGHGFRDILRHILGGPTQPHKPGQTVRDMMATPALTTTAEAEVTAVARILDQHRIKRLPVVDSEGRLIGIISRADIVRLMTRP